MERPFHPRFIDTCAPLDAGGVLEADHKLWVYQSGEVYWELRRLLHYKSPGNLNTPLHKQIKKVRQLWVTEFEYFGIPASGFKDSFNAARCKGDIEALSDCTTRQEYSVSTGAAVVLMLFWCRTSRQVCARDRCRALLEGWLQRVGGSLEKLIDVLQGFLEAGACACKGAALAGEVCPHGADVMQRLGPGTWRSMIDCLMHLRMAADNCPAAKMSLIDFCGALAKFVDALALRDDSRMGMKSNLRHRELLRTGQKKRHIDEDYKYETSVLAVRRRDGPNTARILRGDGLGATSSSGRYWEGQLCLEHRAACMASFESARIIHICEDGSRLGDPAEETIVYIAWSADLMCAGFPPPQVESIKRQLFVALPGSGDRCLLVVAGSPKALDVRLIGGLVLPCGAWAYHNPASLRPPISVIVSQWRGHSGHNIDF